MQAFIIKKPEGFFKKRLLIHSLGLHRHSLPLRSSDLVLEGSQFSKSHSHPEYEEDNDKQEDLLENVVRKAVRFDVVPCASGAGAVLSVFLVHVVFHHK
ncbi:MAG: hypothetical protein JWM20_631 [Patescibacteria group bacterium]|nr:hypothetical protein [Patescibacteria group bacterium]